MGKGVSPVIASILIILVAVSMASAYIVFTDRIFGGVTEEGEETVSRTTQELFSDFTISSASGQRVFIKNTGTSELSASALDMFYDSEPIEFAADFDTLEEDELGTLTLRGLWKHGPGTHSLRISAGSFQDTASVQATPHRSVVGDWRFEEGSGTTAEDASGNDKDGTLENGADWSTNTPLSTSDYSIELDGVSEQRVSAGDITFGQSGFTAESWIHVESNPPGGKFSGGIIGQGVTDGLQFALRDSRHLYSRVYDGSTYSGWENISTAQLETDTWYHVTYVANRDSEGVFYVNGERINGHDISGRSDQDVFVRTDIGHNNWLDSESEGESFHGNIDSPRLYASAIEPDELYSLSLRG